METYNYSAQMKDKYLNMTMELLDKLPPYCTSYINSIRERTQPRTMCGYAQDLRVFFYFLLQNNPALKGKTEKEISLEVLNALDQDDIVEYMMWLESYTIDGVKYHNERQGKKRKLSSLRSFYKYLTTTKGLIKNNPAVAVDPPKILKKEVRPLDQDERVHLFEEIEKEYEDAVKKAILPDAGKRERLMPSLVLRDKAIIYLFLGSGMRISELVGIDLNDIKPELNRINIVRKGGKYDHVYISDEVMDAVSEYAYGGPRDAIGVYDEDSEALFLSSARTRITVRSVERQIKKYADRALGEKSGITPHKCRSTFGTQYYEATHDLYATADVLGHASVETTRKHYIKPGESSKIAMKNINVFGDQ